ncbi:polyprenol phosphomannose-dependent alpha 1,6 mannosyltransferase MptB [Catellatospora sp. NPDC049609]|uniref:polyprenol phosphomannose-dependent alpha 1,6 mannosyltransferase MptB n=1 Tax=Catellatospora sp. NPDC049609 TaxID=3155505 RepID=UPI00341D9EE8
MLPRPATSRAAVALGCVSGVLLAVSAFLAGALPGDLGPDLQAGGLGAVPASFLAGLACWLLGMAGWTTAWWWLGRPLWPSPHAAADSRSIDSRSIDSRSGDSRSAGLDGAPGLGRPDRSARRLLLIGAAWAAPLLVAPPLGSRDVYAYACQGWLWRAGLDPYAMGVADGGCPWSPAVPELWWHTPTPYGPVGVVLSGAVTWLGGLLGALGGLRLLAVAALVLLAATLPTLARACGVPVAAAYWIALLTPLTAVHALSAAHNDVLVAALTVAALALALPRDRDDLARTVALSPGTPVSHPQSTQDRRGWRGVRWAVAAGLVVAGAVGVKVTAVVVVPFVLVLLGRRWWVGAVAGVGGFAVFSVVSGLGWGWVGALRGTGQLTQWSSPPTAVGMTVGYVLRGLGHGEWAGTAVGVARVVGVLVLAGVGLAGLRHAWRHREQPRVVVLACGWVMAATALLGPVFYPWYALAPLAVLAAAETEPRRRRWLAVAAVTCAFLTLPDGLGVPVLTKGVGAPAVTIALIVAAVRSRPRARA